MKSKDDSTQGWLVSDTWILMAGGDIKPIHDIRLGDCIIAGDGSMQSVTRVHRKYIKEQLIAITHRGNGDSIVTTPGQNIVIQWRTGDGKFYKKEYGPRKAYRAMYVSELNLGIVSMFGCSDVIDLLNYCPVLKQMVEYSVFLKQLQISKGLTTRALAKYVGISRNTLWRKTNIPNITKDTLKYYCGTPVKRDIKIDFDLGKFIGLFLAEGTAKENKVTFALHIKEKDLSQFITKIAQSKFGLIAKTRLLPKVHTRIVSIHSYILVAFLEQWCYVNGDKRLTRKMWQLDYLKGVLCGIVLGDGCVLSRYKKIVVTMSRENLIRDIYIASNMCGIYPTLSKTYKRFRPQLKKKISIIKSVIYQRKEFEKLACILQIATKSKPIINKRNKKTCDRIFLNNHILSKVTNTTTLMYRGYVYKLSVSGPKSYIANSVVIKWQKRNETLKIK